MAKKTIKIKENELVDLINNLVTEAMGENYMNELDAPAAPASPIQTKIQPEDIRTQKQLGTYLFQIGNQLKTGKTDLALNTKTVQSITNLIQTVLNQDVKASKVTTAATRITPQ